ncbi:MAG: HAD hydrolase-like protein, partial [Syntrophales bacterium]
LLAGAQEFDVDLASSYMVGDRWRDVEAGISAGCKTIFIAYGYNEKQPKSSDYKVSLFSDAVNIILKGRGHEKS